MNIQDTLRDIQLRVSLIQGRRMTQKELANVARVNVRSLGEWMRGGASPMGMSAVLHLLATLPPEHVQAVLQPWRESETAEDSVLAQQVQEHRNVKHNAIHRSTSDISHTEESK